MKSRFGKKFRILSAIEKNNILLLNNLMIRQNHAPDKPVDKLGNNIFQVACTTGNLNMIQYIYDTYHLDINHYNSDGLNAVHLAAKYAHVNVLEWLNEHGADLHSRSRSFLLSAYDMTCLKLQKNRPPNGYNTMTPAAKQKLIDVKVYLRSKYFMDNRGKEIRKFLWVYEKLRGKSTDIGKLPQAMIQEIAEYF